jgi:hypothetical protein
MTCGTDGKNMDGMSIERIKSLIEVLKDESYQPNPSRRTYIPKKNGKMRPLDIPAIDDKLLQEVVKMILDAIYEGQFEPASHGFRLHRSCHTALDYVKTAFTGAEWFIEGDIKGFFDNIDHDVMINIPLANNSMIIHSFYNIMEYSMYKTFASKYQSTVRKVIRKYSRNREFVITYMNKKGEKKQCEFYNGGFKHRDLDRKNHYFDNFPSIAYYMGKLTTKLMDRLKRRVCEYCGAIGELKNRAGKRRESHYIQYDGDTTGYFRYGHKFRKTAKR